MKKKNYINITKDWLNNRDNEIIVEESNYYESNGIKYYVDNKNVILDYSKKELEVAIWLTKIFGYKVKLLPRINVPEGIKTADYLFKDELWDLKEINGYSKYSFGHAVEGKKKQANNFIFDITKSKLSKKDIYVQLNLLFASKHTSCISKVIIKDNKKLLGVYKKEMTSVQEHQDHLINYDYTIIFKLCQIFS